MLENFFAGKEGGKVYDTINSEMQEQSGFFAVITGHNPINPTTPANWKTTKREYTVEYTWEALRFDDGRPTLVLEDTPRKGNRAFPASGDVTPEIEDGTIVWMEPVPSDGIYIFWTNEEMSSPPTPTASRVKFLEPCDVVYTQHVNISSLPATQRSLLVGQSDPAENGIYIFGMRASDANTPEKLNNCVVAAAHSNSSSLSLISTGLLYWLSNEITSMSDPKHFRIVGAFGNVTTMLGDSIDAGGGPIMLWAGQVNSPTSHMPLIRITRDDKYYVSGAFNKATIGCKGTINGNSFAVLSASRDHPGALSEVVAGCTNVSTLDPEGKSRYSSVKMYSGARYDINFDPKHSVSGIMFTAEFPRPTVPPSTFIAKGGIAFRPSTSIGDGKILDFRMVPTLSYNGNIFLESTAYNLAMFEELSANTIHITSIDARELFENPDITLSKFVGAIPEPFIAFNISMPSVNSSSHITKLIVSASIYGKPTFYAANDLNGNSKIGLTTNVGGLEFTGGLLTGGNLQAPPPVSDGDKGDIVVSNNGSTWTIDDGAITNPKIAPGTIGVDKLGAIPANSIIGNPDSAPNVPTVIVASNQHEVLIKRGAFLGFHKLELNDLPFIGGRLIGYSEIVNDFVTGLNAPVEIPGTRVLLPAGENGLIAVYISSNTFNNTAGAVCRTWLTDPANVNTVAGRSASATANQIISSSYMVSRVYNPFPAYVSVAADVSGGIGTFRGVFIAVFWLARF